MTQVLKDIFSAWPSCELQLKFLDHLNFYVFTFMDVL